ncbi:MAG: IclR family transcriptional regulator [Actinomycetota bacterium]|nr:IclR family transcriptional regulator [Actinomycetota bacterium]
MATGTQSIDRAAELLALVVQSAEPLTFTGLTQTTGLSRSTTSRVLQALERHRLVDRDPDGAFCAGDLFVSYASRHDSVGLLVRQAQETMTRISEQTGESVNLAIANGRNVVQVAQVESTYLLGTTNWVGVSVPPHCSALGKIMYAYDALPLPSGALERRTDATITELDRLEAELEGIRRRGFATTRGELEEGLAGIAAPVRSGDRVTASIGVSGPIFRLADTWTQVGELLVDESDRLSTALDTTLEPGARGNRTS